MNRSRWIVLVIVAGLLALGAYRYQNLQQGPVAVTSSPPVRVEILTLAVQPLTTWVFAEGTAEALQKSFLNFERAGKVVFIGDLPDGTPIREGARVFGPSEGLRLGQLLARLDNRESTSEVQALEARLQSANGRIREAEAQLDIAQNNQRQADKDFARVEAVYDKGLVSKEQFEGTRTAMLNARVAVSAANSGLQAALSEQKSLAAELNRATVSLEKTSLFAPFDGVITTMNLLEGNYYYPPAMINSRREREASSAIVIVDDSRFEIRLEVTEEDALGIREGQTVYLAQDDRQLYQAAQSGFNEPAVVRGEVWSVSPSLSLQRRSQQIKVRTDGNVSDIRDGMFVRAWIASHEEAEALALPLSALSFSKGRPYVFVVGDDERVSLRWLELGLQGLRRVQVLQGLEVGERVVVQGQHLLADQSPVTVLQSAGEQP